MKKLIFIVLLAVSSNLLFAQTENDSIVSKEEAKKAKAEEQYKKLQNLVENKHFVLEADYLRDRYIARQPVSPMINFIKVDSDVATIQIGSTTAIGSNGVGGVTAKGRISTWEVKKNKKGNALYVNMNVMTTIGIYDIYMSIGASGTASAKLTGLTRGELIFDGDVVPTEESLVYEGISL